MNKNRNKKLLKNNKKKYDKNSANNFFKQKNMFNLEGF